MSTFNKINQPVYTTLQGYSVLSDGSIQIEHIIGVGEDTDGEMKNFTRISSQWLTIQAGQAQELLNQPLSKDDIGKTPNEIMLDRIYNHLKSTNEIVV